MVSGTCASPFSSAAAAARAPCPQLKGKEEEERGRKFDGSLTWADALELCVYAALENSRKKKEDFAYVFYPLWLHQSVNIFQRKVDSNIFYDYNFLFLRQTDRGYPEPTF